MLERMIAAGMDDACRLFGVDRAKLAVAMPPNLMSRLKTFGSGQLDAAKALGNNLRGGFGGNLGATSGMPESAMTPNMAKAMRGHHRQQAWGNVKTLAPSLAAAAGGAYLLGRPSEEERQQQMQMRQMRGY